MKSPPYMRWFPSDYLAATLHLNRDENSAYRDLIDHCWLRGGRLPDDDNLLARLTRCDAAAWRVLRTKLAPFFKISNGFWKQKRITKELHIAQNRSAAASENAAKRWDQKKKPKNAAAHAPADATVVRQHMRGQCYPEPEPDGAVEVRTSTAPTPPTPPRGGNARTRARKPPRSFGPITGLYQGAADATESYIARHGLRDRDDRD